MSQFEINGRMAGDGCQPFIIAEGCDNHMGSLDTAKEMALRAKLAGADCIKFQHHLPDEEMLPDVPMSDNFDVPLYDFLKCHALKLEQHIALKKYCDEIGITYLCTPFSYKAAWELNEAGLLHAIKIGSGEMTDIPSLLKMAEFGKPMIISCGMSEWEELDRTYDALSGCGIPLAFTNCLSEYPPVYEDVNLKVMEIMRQRYPGAVIGHSDHTPDLFTSFAAAALGAAIIEKHVIIDKLTPGPDQSVSIDFVQLHELCDGVKKIWLSLGDKKEIHEKEKDIRKWAFRSVVSIKDIQQGEIITQDMVWSKRPGTGIPSYKMQEVIGKKARVDIKCNSLIKYEDFEQVGR